MSTIWLERFVLGGVCVAAFVSLVVLNILKFDWTQRTTLGGAILLFSYFVGHTIEKQRESRTSSATFSTQSPSLTEPPKSDAPKQSVSPSEASKPPAVTSHAHDRPKSGPLTSLSDGQRFVLKQKLGAYAGKSVRLVVIGGDPPMGIVFEQLIDIFKDAGWKIETDRIGMVSIVGTNLPSVPYLTGPDIASATLRKVFSIFAEVGIDLPLTPDAFMGPGSTGVPPDVVIVVK